MPISPKSALPPILSPFGHPTRHETMLSPFGHPTLRHETIYTPFTSSFRLRTPITSNWPRRTRENTCVCNSTVSCSCKALLGSESSEKPHKPQDITPLPKLQLASLLFLRLAESVAAKVIYPFISDLINYIGVTGGDAKKIGYYAGFVESLLYIAEFISLLQWGRLSDRIGRKPVLLFGVFGLALSMISFGLSTSFVGLLISRALAGALCGNVGVITTVLGEITDETNSAVGFGMVPVVWGIGDTLGPTIGGYLARPAETYPNYFKARFWTLHPYFLPCAAAAGVALMSFIVAFLFLKETFPRARRQEHAKRWKLIPQDDTECSTGEKRVSTNQPRSFRSLLTKPVCISTLNYAALSLVAEAITTVQPIVLAAPISSGGVGLSAKTIGKGLAMYGFINCFFQIYVSPRIQKKLGTKRALLISTACTIPAILFLPIMNFFTITFGGRVNAAVWLVLALQYVTFSAIQMAYCCAFILITTSTPDQESLGAVNGLSQTTSAFMSAFGPPAASALFAVSNERNLAGGCLVYIVMVGLALLAIGVTYLIPEAGWSHSREGED